MDELEYQWIVESTKWDIATGGITTAFWRVNLTDGPVTVTRYGSAGFSPDPESPDYLPLEDITEDVVLQWVKDSLDVESIESGMLAELDTIKNPVEQTGLPWS